MSHFWSLKWATSRGKVVFWLIVAYTFLQYKWSTQHMIIHQRSLLVLQAFCHLHTAAVSIHEIKAILWCSGFSSCDRVGLLSQALGGAWKRPRLKWTGSSDILDSVVGGRDGPVGILELSKWQLWALDAVNPKLLLLNDETECSCHTSMPMVNGSGLTQDYHTFPSQTFSNQAGTNSLHESIPIQHYRHPAPSRMHALLSTLTVQDYIEHI